MRDGGTGVMDRQGQRLARRYSWGGKTEEQATTVTNMSPHRSEGRLVTAATVGTREWRGGRAVSISNWGQSRSLLPKMPGLSVIPALPDCELLYSQTNLIFTRSGLSESPSPPESDILGFPGTGASCSGRLVRGGPEVPLACLLLAPSVLFLHP